MSPKFVWKTRPGITLLCLMVLASVLAGLGPSLLFASEKGPKQVLVLNSYHDGLNWTDDIMTGIREVFSQQAIPPKVYVEYMDTKRNDSTEYLSQVLEDFLTRKFKDKRFDLILLSDNNALNFVRKHRGDLFAGVPVVFCGINNFKPSMIEGMGAVTGVAEMPEISKTIDIALNLHPETEEIIFIGRTDVVTAQLNDELFQAAAREFEGRVIVTFWNDVPLEELQARLHRLDPGRLVFHGSWLKTASGRILTFVDSVRKIREASNVPLYSFWDIFFGEGIVGGKLVSGLPHGRLAAQLAVRILSGENPEAIEVATTESNAYMFDYRELKRFGISLKALPEGSLVIHGPSPFYEISEKQLWTALVFMVGLSVALLMAMMGRMRAVKALRISEERFRSVINSSPMGIYLYRLEPDSRLVLTGANPATDTILGVDNQTLIGETIEEGFPHLAETEVPARFREVCMQGRPWHTEQLNYEDQNIKGAFEVYAFPTGPDMMACMFSDITERKQAEEELQAAHRQLQDIIEFLPDATFVIDRESKVVAWNQAIEEMTGISKEEMIGQGDYAYAVPFYGKRRPFLLDLVGSPELEKEGRYKSVRKRGETLFLESEYLPCAYDGKGAYFWAAASRLFDKEGDCVGAIESIRDITERKQAEEELQAAHRQLQDIIEFLPDATFVIDRENKVVAWNRAIEEMTGISKAEMIDQGDYAYGLAFYGSRRPLLIDLLDEPNSAIEAQYDLLERQGRSIYAEGFVPSLYNGKGAYLWGKASPLLDQEGNRAGAIESLRDSTERKQAEEDLKEANRELDAFVYTVSHDLRIPLTPIIGYADFLHESCRDRLDEQALNCLAEISASGERMMALMEDLLTLAKVGQVERPAEPFDAGEVVNDVVCGLAEIITQAGVAVNVGDLPTLRVPKTLLTQIFDNLIGNAVRYAGRKGSPIKVGGERRGELVRFYVRDHGPGIPKEERSRIFEVFYRGATGKKSPGTGVGLATVQKVARLYGGRAWVEETEGGGSTFWVEMVDVPTAAENEEDTL